MNAKDAIHKCAAASHHVLSRYCEDLSDQDLMLRPAAGCNHLAWQLGHLITSEVELLSMVCPDHAAELPAGFADKHGKDKAGSDNPSDFCTKQEYFDVWSKVRQGTLAAVAELPDEDLDKPGPERLREVFPTMGDVLLLIANHPMMHAGQFVPVRRSLGKKIAI